MSQKLYKSTSGNEHKEKSKADIDSFIHEFANIITKSDTFDELYVNFENWPIAEQIMAVNQLKGIGILVLYESDKIMEILKKYQFWYDKT
jgi:hypothetical protein